MTLSYERRAGNKAREEKEWGMVKESNGWT